MAQEKTFYILRHAKAEAVAANQEDYERGLNARGILSTRAIGEYMAKNRIAPQKILCSGAVRTRQTLAGVEKAYGSKLPADYSEKLYHASADAMLGMLAQLPETLKSAMIVGHNPGLHQLCIKLACNGDDALIDRLSLKLPTCSLATFTMDGPWRNIPSAEATLKGFITPLMLGIPI